MTASAVGESPKQISAIGMMSKLRCKGEQCIECVVIGVAVVDMNKFTAVVPFLSVIAHAIGKGLKAEEKTPERAFFLPSPRFRSFLT